MRTVELVAGRKFLGAAAEEVLGGKPEKAIGRASARKCTARTVAAVKAGWWPRVPLPGKPVVFIPPRYRFDFDHITKMNPCNDDEHFGAVAVTLDTGDPLARAAIVDASGCRACRA
jgi:hypothetical protein